MDVRTKMITVYKSKSDFRAIFAVSFEAIGQGWYQATKNGLIDNQTVDTEVRASRELETPKSGVSAQAKAKTATPFT
ncbi:MAG: hypothetical protein HC853_12820 [Anaerolineae bacterium]|nr:hypothetical protein [Anaerolineae bacterium]